jgi:hypothetical protein
MKFESRFKEVIKTREEKCGREKQREKQIERK